MSLAQVRAQKPTLCKKNRIWREDVQVSGSRVLCFCFGLKFKWNHVPGNDCLIFVTSAESDDLPSIHRPVLEHIWAFRCFVSWNPTLFFGHSKISIDPWSIWLLAEFITHVDRQDNLSALDGLSAWPCQSLSAQSSAEEWGTRKGSDKLSRSLSFSSPYPKLCT